MQFQGRVTKYGKIVAAIRVIDIDHFLKGRQKIESLRKNLNYLSKFESATISLVYIHVTSKLDTLFQKRQIDIILEISYLRSRHTHFHIPSIRFRSPLKSSFL